MTRFPPAFIFYLLPIKTLMPATRTVSRAKSRSIPGSESSYFVSRDAALVKARRAGISVESVPENISSSVRERHHPLNMPPPAGLDLIVDLIRPRCRADGARNADSRSGLEVKSSVNWCEPVGSGAHGVTRPTHFRPQTAVKPVCVSSPSRAKNGRTTIADQSYSSSQIWPRGALKVIFHPIYLRRSGL